MGLERRSTEIRDQEGREMTLLQSVKPYLEEGEPFERLIKQARCTPKAEPPGVLRVGVGYKGNPLKGVENEGQRSQV